MSLVEPIIAISVLTAAAIGTLVLILRESKRRARRVLKREPVTIASVKPGKAATIAGSTRAAGAMSQCLLGQPCLFARIEVEHFFRRKGTDGNYSERWKPVAAETRGGNFFVADSSGAVLVVPQGAVLPEPTTYRNVDWKHLAKGDAEFIARYQNAIDRSCPARMREMVIRAGDTVRVHGTITDEQGGPRLSTADKAFLAIGFEPAP